MTYSLRILLADKWETPMPQEVIRTWADARGRDSCGVVLLETPGEWVRGIVGLLALSKEFKDIGLIVTNVGPNGAAARAGIARGDVLLRYDGVDLDTVARLCELTERAALSRDSCGQIDAIRGDRERQVKVAAGRLGVTVSAPLHRLKLHWLLEATLKTRGPVFAAKWRPI
jgi:hypothetical protein